MLHNIYIYIYLMSTKDTYRKSLFQKNKNKIKVRDANYASHYSFFLYILYNTFWKDETRMERKLSINSFGMSIKKMIKKLKKKKSMPLFSGKTEEEKRKSGDSLVFIIIDSPIFITRKTTYTWRRKWRICTITIRTVNKMHTNNGLSFYKVISNVN